MSPLQHLLAFVSSIPGRIVNAFCSLVFAKLKHKALHIKMLKLISELPQSKDCTAGYRLPALGSIIRTWYSYSMFHREQSSLTVPKLHRKLQELQRSSGAVSLC